MTFPLLPTPAVPGTLTTKEDWHDFVTSSPPDRPDKPAIHDWRTMSSIARQAFDQARLDYHSASGPIVTPTLKRIHEVLARQVQANHAASPGARRGSVVDGHGALGKTTIITMFGRKYDHAIRAQSATSDSPDLFIPVVYITLPADTTVKGLNRAMAEFYGAPVSSRATKDDLTILIQQVARRCRTTLFLVDDIHYLNMNNSEHRIVGNHLKHLANTVAATFIYAGINCEETGLFHEGRGKANEQASQTRRRFNLLPVEPFSIADAASTREWQSLLKALEEHLVLLESEAGDLCQRLWLYTFERTNGVIGSLSALVRQAANLAIATGAERITEALLDQIQLDHAAEEARSTHRARRSPRRSPSATPMARQGGSSALANARASAT